MLLFADGPLPQIATDLAGLVVAEVEFDDEQAAREFMPPAWFGREVTGEPGWANRSLGVDGLPPGEDA